MRVKEDDVDSDGSNDQPTPDNEGVNEEPDIIRKGEEDGETRPD